MSNRKTTFRKICRFSLFFFQNRVKNKPMRAFLNFFQKNTVGKNSNCVGIFDTLKKAVGTFQAIPTSLSAFFPTRLRKLALVSPLYIACVSYMLNTCLQGQAGANFCRTVGILLVTPVSRASHVPTQKKAL